MLQTTYGYCEYSIIPDPYGGEQIQKGVGIYISSIYINNNVRGKKIPNQDGASLIEKLKKAVKNWDYIKLEAYEDLTKPGRLTNWYKSIGFEVRPDIKVRTITQNDITYQVYQMILHRPTATTSPTVT